MSLVEMLYFSERCITLLVSFVHCVKEKVSQNINYLSGKKYRAEP